MDIIEQKIKQLTNGLPADKASKKIFEYIRDRPYHLVPLSNASQLIKNGFGDCRGKHDLLAKMFSVLKIPVKHFHMEFDWRNSPLPKQIISKLKPVGFIWPHYSLKALIDDKWIIVDATWDSALKKAGFPVNKWGKNMIFITKNVRNAKEISGLKEHIKYFLDVYRGFKKMNDAFIFAEALNSYLEKIRKK